MNAIRSPLLLVLVALLAACSGREAPSVPEDAIALAAEFQARWWSPAQMEGLDPDDPPPKETVVVLQRWEYSDPIGVPNPDTVDLVVTVANPGRAPLDLVLRATRRWREGSLEDEGDSAWSARELLGERAVRIGPRSKEAVRFEDVDLRAKQSELYARDRWPWELEVRVEALARAGGLPLATTVARLPMTPGD